MKNFFEYDDYRTLLRHCADDRKNLQRDYTYADLAKAIQVQPPYLSRVFRKEADLNTDQLYMACTHFSWSEEQTEFAALLLELSRSIVMARKTQLRQKISTFREQQQHSKNHLKAEFLSLDESMRYHEYYLDPLVQVVHMCLTVTNYQSDLSLLSRLLNIPPIRLDEILQILQKLELIQFDKKKKHWVVLLSHLQLDQKSKLSLVNHVLQRHTSVEHM